MRFDIEESRMVFEAVEVGLLVESIVAFAEEDMLVPSEEGRLACSLDRDSLVLDEGPAHH